MVHSIGKNILCAIKITALFVCVALVFSSCGAFNSKSYKIKEYYEIETENDFHNTENYESIVKSDNYELLYDDTSKSIAVRNIKSGYIFRSLSENINNFESVINFDIVCDNTVYSLNTQDNSVAVDTAVSEKIENGIKVKYELKNGKDSDILGICTVEYTFENDELDVKAEFENRSGARILTAEILPYFGSVESVTANDCFIVPDGVGAVMELSYNDDVTNSVNFDVYGGDISIVSAGKQCIMPVFCEKCSDNGFCSVIYDGDGVCNISAKRKSGDIPARIYPSFTLSTYCIDNEKVTVGDDFQKSIGIKYRFVSQSGLDYSSFSSYARELFIETGFLSRNRLDSGDYAFNLSVIGSFKNEDTNTRNIVDFDDIRTFLGLLKGKGIDKINVFCKGVLTGGVNQKGIFGADVLSSVGGKDGLSSLYEYTKTENLKLYIDCDLISAGGFGFSSGKTAKSINGDKIKYDSENPVFETVGENVFSKEILSTDNIGKASLKLIKMIDKLSVDGVCINDLSKIIYSDYSHKGYNAQSFENTAKTAFENIGASSVVCVDTGNFYSVKNADVILNMPYTNSVSGEGYECIPFAQMILHGYSSYSFERANTVDDYKTYVLKCIEYGAEPYFEYVFDENSSLFYGNTLSDAVEFFKNINKNLNGLNCYVIIEHKKVKDGLYCIKYESGSVIYVNYNNKSVIADNGITVNAQSVLRID